MVDRHSIRSARYQGNKAKIVTKFKEGGERSGVWEHVADVTPKSGSMFRAKTEVASVNDVVWLEQAKVIPMLDDVHDVDRCFGLDRAGTASSALLLLSKSIALLRTAESDAPG